MVASTRSCGPRRISSGGGSRSWPLPPPTAVRTMTPATATTAPPAISPRLRRRRACALRLWRGRPSVAGPLLPGRSRGLSSTGQSRGWLPGWQHRRRHPTLCCVAVRAVTFQAPGEVRLEERPDPEPVAADDAVVRVQATGICGSDLHIYHGRVAIEP